jgi:hypothetical protein
MLMSGEIPRRHHLPTFNIADVGEVAPRSRPLESKRGAIEALLIQVCHAHAACSLPTQPHANASCLLHDRALPHFYRCTPAVTRDRCTLARFMLAASIKWDALLIAKEL